MPAHSAAVQVRFYELDPYGHVNHTVYIQYFESARVELLHQVGFGLDRLQAEGHLIVVSRIATRFLASAVLSDRLTVETGVLWSRRVSSRWAQRIRRGPEVIATQIVDLAGTDPNGRIVRFPSALVDAIAAFAVPADWLGGHSPL